MKEIIKKLEKVNRLIEETQSEIEVINELPFYKIFKKDFQQKLEINSLRISLQKLLNQKYTILENLQLEATKQLMDISQSTRELVLIKTI